MPKNDRFLSYLDATFIHIRWTPELHAYADEVAGKLPEGLTALEAAAAFNRWASGQPPKGNDYLLREFLPPRP